MKTINRSDLPEEVQSWVVDIWRDMAEDFELVIPDVLQVRTVQLRLLRKEHEQWVQIDSGEAEGRYAEEHVVAMMEAITAGKVTLPLIKDRLSDWVYDGHLRLAALYRLGYKKWDVVEIPQKPIQVVASQPTAGLPGVAVQKIDWSR